MKCKQNGCNGKIIFVDTLRKNTYMFKKIVDIPVQCPKCGYSYYKHEFE